MVVNLNRKSFELCDNPDTVLTGPLKRCSWGPFLLAIIKLAKQPEVTIALQQSKKTVFLYFLFFLLLTQMVASYGAPKGTRKEKKTFARSCKGFSNVSHPEVKQLRRTRRSKQTQNNGGANKLSIDFYFGLQNKRKANNKVSLLFLSLQLPLQDTEKCTLVFIKKTEVLLHSPPYKQMELSIV